MSGVLDDATDWIRRVNKPEMAGIFDPSYPVHAQAFADRGGEIMRQMAERVKSLEMATRRQLVKRMLESARVREAIGAYAKSPRNWGRIQRLKKAWLAELRKLS